MMSGRRKKKREKKEFTRKAMWPGVSRKVMRSFEGISTTNDRMSARKTNENTFDEKERERSTLSDASCFRGGDVGATQGVEERSLPVVNVTHDAHHRRTTNQSNLRR